MKKPKRAHGRNKVDAEAPKVPLEYGYGPTESLLYHLLEGCLTDRWVFDEKDGKLKDKNHKLVHLRRICEWFVKLRGCLPGGIQILDILMLIRGPLLVNDKEIRASALRILRYCLNSPEDVYRFEDTNLPSLVVRIIDTNYDENSFQDRVQALKLIRKLLTVAPSHLPNCLITSLVSIINCSSKPTEKTEKRQHVARDRLYRACIEIICEVSFELPELVIELGGFDALLDAILDNSISADNPSISESMILTILHLVKYSSNPPDVHLSFLMSPFFDGNLRDVSVDTSRNQYQASRLALNCLLRNWSGMAFLCQARSLAELLAVFCCNLHEKNLIKSLLGLLFDIFGLSIHDDFYQASDMGDDVDKLSIFQYLVKKNEEIRLSDFGEFSLEKSFIVGEAKQKLGIIPDDDFDLTLCYQAFLLAILLESRIVENLIMLITSSRNETIAARAGFLLAEIDQLSAKFLPISQFHDTISSATGEIITAHFMKIVNDPEQDQCAQRRAHQAIYWLKNYSRYRSDASSAFLLQPSIYLSHQLNLQNIVTNEKKSTPNKEVLYNTRRRSAVWDTISKPLGSMTRSFTDNSLDQLASDRLGRRMTRDMLPISYDIPYETESNRFCEYIVDTYVLSGTEFTCWNWNLLVEKLECYDLIPEILLGEDHSIQVFKDTNTFFNRLVSVFAHPKIYLSKVEWKDNSTEDEKTKVTVKVAMNLIKLLVRIYRYHLEKVGRTHPAAEKAINLLISLRDYVFGQTVELGTTNGYDLRSRVSNHNACIIRYIPLLFSYLVYESSYIQSETDALITSDHWEQLRALINKPLKIQDDSECVIFPKMILSSLNFSQSGDGCGSSSKVRIFVSEILREPSTNLAVFFIDLVRFWIDRQLNWIYQDGWIIEKLIRLVINRPKNLSTLSDTVIEKAIDTVRIMITNPQLLEIIECDDTYLNLAMSLKNRAIRNNLLMVMCISESISRRLNVMEDSNDNGESILDTLLENWMSTGQYEFLDEVDARLRIAFTTSEVKFHNVGEILRRGHQNHQKPAVYLPMNFLRFLVQHEFGIKKILPQLSPIKEHAHESFSDGDSVLDRRVIIWTCGALCSSDLGCRRFGSDLMKVLIENAASNELAIKATSYYAICLVGTCSLGAELLEVCNWKVKKCHRRFRVTQRDLNKNDSSSGSESVTDSARNSSVIQGSQDQLVQSLEKLCDFERPLIVSILKQWSYDESYQHEPDDYNLTCTRTTQPRDQFREQRSVSDTTAMELAILRHHQSQRLSPKKVWSRPRRNTGSTTSEGPSLSPLEPLPEMDTSPTLSLEHKLDEGCEMSDFRRTYSALASTSPKKLYKEDSSEIYHGQSAIKNPKPRRLASSPADVQISESTNNSFKFKSAYQQGISWASKKLIKSFRKTSIRKSVTAPDFSSPKQGLNDSYEIDDLVFESQFRACDEKQKCVPGNNAKHLDKCNDFYGLSEYIGIALPPDLFGFLRVQHQKKICSRRKVNDRVFFNYPNVDGGLDHLLRLARIEQLEVNEMDDEVDTCLTEVGTIEHLEEMHDEIIKIINWMIKGREKPKEKLLYLRRKWPHYFQSIKLYNRIIDLLKSNDVSVADRQFIHEIFDWRCTDRTSSFPRRLFFSEIELISSQIYQRLKVST